MIGNENNTNKENDFLKSIWQSQKEEKTYDSKAIFKMIHRKSINAVQWLFIITVIEFMIGISISLWLLLSGKHFFSNEKIDLVGQAEYTKMENFSHLGIIGSIFLIAIVFYFYRKISSTLAVQQLIQNIINFRKTVIGFIIFWLVLIIILITPIMISLGANTYLSQNDTQHLSIEEAKAMAQKIGYITATFNIIIILIFSAIYYGFIYGTFLKRLGKNLKELKSINH